MHTHSRRFIRKRSIGGVARSGRDLAFRGVYWYALCVCCVCVFVLARAIVSWSWPHPRNNATCEPVFFSSVFLSRISVESERPCVYSPVSISISYAQDMEAGQRVECVHGICTIVYMQYVTINNTPAERCAPRETRLSAVAQRWRILEIIRNDGPYKYAVNATAFLALSRKMHVECVPRTRIARLSHAPQFAFTRRVFRVLWYSGIGPISAWTCWPNVACWCRARKWSVDYCVQIYAWYANSLRWFMYSIL